MSPRSESPLRSALVWDNHACLPLRTDATFLPQLERFRAVGVNVVSLNIGFAEIPWTDHLRVLAFMRRWLARRPHHYCLVSSVEDVRRCKRDGRLGVVFDIEGMGPVVHDVSLVQTFYELGVRWMLIAYNRNSLAGGGCLDSDGGLTALGRRIIDEMERVGMVLCLSHAGVRTASDALEYSRNPTIFSHSNPYGHTPHPRNISDQIMVRCAEKGGVVGLAGFAPFLGGNDALIDRLLAHLRYVIDLVGAEHVGLGLDYVFDRAELADYVRLDPSLFPGGFDDAPHVGMVAPEAVTEIAEGLARDNLSDAHIRGILGENWLRIARQVWR